LEPQRKGEETLDSGGNGLEPQRNGEETLDNESDDGTIYDIDLLEHDLGLRPFFMETEGARPTVFYLKIKKLSPLLNAYAL
jgi:hypothetical protein